MTKLEEEIMMASAEKAIQYAVDAVIADFESRTCENCRHYGKRFCQYLFDDFSIKLYPEPDFGCVQFERKK